jgi:hypothetical protein
VRCCRCVQYADGVLFLDDESRLRGVTEECEMEAGAGRGSELAQVRSL